MGIVKSVAKTGLIAALSIGGWEGYHSLMGQKVPYSIEVKNDRAYFIDHIAKDTIPAPKVTEVYKLGQVFQNKLTAVNDKYKDW